MEYKQLTDKLVYQPIIDKPPSAGLWKGQTDLELNYDQIDRYLASGEASAALRKRVESMIASSQHKHQPPPVADFSGEG
jgi:NAD+ synthase